MKKPLILYTLFVFLATACSSGKLVKAPDHPTTQATLWVQNAAEYDALALQAYGNASRILPLTLEDSFWTASVNQTESEEISKLPPAIILDVDETVLDNSPFQARMIKQNKSFNSTDWNAWCNEAKADGVPGAAEFTQYAANKGIAIFYVSNRDYTVEDATRQNLIKEGFPVSDTLDNIMLNGEEPGWNSSKIQRRRIIEENYRVVMIFGDDLNDFLPAKDIKQSKRDALIDKHASNFGRRWFILPNPIYGSWEQALINFEDDLSEQERAKRLNNRLKTKE